MKKVISEPGRTFSEFSVLPDGKTTERCKIENVSLETEVAGIKHKIPLWSAAMMSVTGYLMTLELGRRGGMGILPNKLSVEEQVDIVKKIKEYEMEFVEKPVLAYNDETIGDVLDKVAKHGHSNIPIVDEYRNFMGMFIQERVFGSGRGPNENVTEVMVPFNNGNSEIEFCDNPLINVSDVKEMFARPDMEGKYIVVIDNQGRFVKLAFKQDIEEIPVGAAISTHEGWRERVAANIKAGVDLIVVDASDGYSEFQENLIRAYKSNPDFAHVPICGGNVVTYDGVMNLLRAGADIVKLGMSTGSICTTRREKAVGRAPIPALMDANNAIEDYKEESGREAYIAWDGGASCAADWIVALTCSHIVMCGGYFNHFFEAAGEKYNADGKITKNEGGFAYVATWGEGSERGRNEDRYGQSRRTFFTEGEEGHVPYLGRMKPYLERDLNKIKAALSNAGCQNLDEYRRESVLELMSPAAQGIVGDTHSIKSIK